MSHVLADTHTAPTKDAQVVIAVEERIVMLNWQSPIGDRVGNLSQVHILHQFRQLTPAVIGTVLTACGDGCLPDCALEIIAIHPAFAYQTAVWVL
jgi:hypothetical protein